MHGINNSSQVGAGIEREKERTSQQCFVAKARQAGTGKKGWEGMVV